MMQNFGLEDLSHVQSRRNLLKYLVRVEMTCDWFTRIYRSILAEEINIQNRDMACKLGCGLFLSPQKNILMTSFFMIFRRFRTTFRRFPKIFQNCSEGHTNVPENFRKFPKMSEDVRRLPKTFEEDPTMFRWYTNEFRYNLRDKLDITEIIDIFTCEDITKSLYVAGI